MLIDGMTNLCNSLEAPAVIQLLFLRRGRQKPDVPF